MCVVSMHSWPSESAITRVSTPASRSRNGGGVSQYVCGDLLFADARALTGGDANVVGDAVFDGVTAERTAGSCG
jgi:hypothetical protein